MLLSLGEDMLNEIFELLVDYSPYFIRGTRNTVAIAFLGVFFGVIFGLMVTLLRMSKNRIISSLAGCYIAVFRGTPMIVQLWIFYLQLSKYMPFPEGMFLGMDMSRLGPCLVALSLNSAAYIAEILRAGIQAVDVGQMEAARSLGFKPWQSMKEIILPQAVKNVLPAICNEFITLIKETAIIQYLGVADLMYSMNSVKTMTYKILPNYYIVGGIYFVLNCIASKGVSILERKMKQDD